MRCQLCPSLTAPQAETALACEADGAEKALLRRGTVFEENWRRFFLNNPKWYAVAFVAQRQREAAATVFF